MIEFKTTADVEAWLKTDGLQKIRRMGQPDKFMILVDPQIDFSKGTLEFHIISRKLDDGDDRYMATQSFPFPVTDDVLLREARGAIAELLQAHAEHKSTERDGE